jgi:hypothetical protein
MHEVSDQQCPTGDASSTHALVAFSRWWVESGLDSLCSRDDSGFLMMDLAMPSEPFVPGR